MAELQSSTSYEAADNDRGPRRHHWTFPKVGAPKLTEEPKTPFGRAWLAAFPWVRQAYPGHYAGMVELLGNRAARETIRSWSKGHRQAPQWARQILAEHLRRRAKDMVEAATAIDQ